MSEDEKMLYWQELVGCKHRIEHLENIIKDRNTWLVRISELESVLKKHLEEEYGFDKDYINEYLFKRKYSKPERQDLYDYDSLTEPIDYKDAEQEPDLDLIADYQILKAKYEKLIGEFLDDLKKMEDMSYQLMIIHLMQLIRKWDARLK